MTNNTLSICLTPTNLCIEQALKEAGVTDIASVSKLTISGTLTLKSFKYIQENMSKTLREFDISNALFSKGHIDIHDFSGFSKLTSIEVNPQNQMISTHNGVVLSKRKKELIYCPPKRQADFVIPDSVKHIKCNAFADCEQITSITIPETVTTIDSGAFCGCSSLTSIVIPSSLNEIQSKTFYKCSSLTSIEIPMSVFSLGTSAFENCIGLTSINIPASVLSVGYSAFSNCIGLIYATISAKIIGLCAFSGCTSLKSVLISASVEEISNNAFHNCPAYFTVHPDNPVYESKSGKITHKQKRKQKTLLCSNTMITMPLRTSGQIKN